jgi:hypothetical protein
MSSNSAVLAEEWWAADPPVQYHRDGTSSSVQVAPSAQGLRHLFRSVFLPQGFPESVSPDYVEYQIWDSVQAFCSYSTNTISVKAMLKGMGVGDESATASAAMVTWLMKDGAGMLGRIGFAWAQGKDLDNNAKQWRIVADAADDVARIVSLLAPAYPAHFREIMCLVQLLYAVVGVAGGATRNAVTQHQSRMNNSGDVSAKDGSQETMVTLLGLCVGLYVTPLLDGHVLLTWCIMLVGSCLHIYSNYRAVRCLQFDTFNGRRASIAMASAILLGADADSASASAQKPPLPGVVPTPAEMAQLEPVFVFPWSVQLPVCLGEQIKDLAATAAGVELLIAAAAPTEAKHLLGLRRGKIIAVVRKGLGEAELLEALFHAEAIRHILLLGPDHDQSVASGLHVQLCDGLRAIIGQQSLSNSCEAARGGDAEALAAILQHTYGWCRAEFPSWQRACLARGWRTDRLQLPDAGWRSTWGVDVISGKDKSS